MIVLVIAAVILLIVFLAVPALQRNSRNTQRNSEASRLSAALVTYLTNGGTIPGNNIANNKDLSDQMAAEANIQQFNKVEMTTNAGSIVNQPVSKNTAQFRLNRLCNTSGNNVITGSQGESPGRIALLFWLESGSGDAGRCLQVR